MTLLQKSPERSSKYTSPPISEPIIPKLPSLLKTVGWEIARLKRSIAPFSEAEIKITHEGNGHYLLSLTEVGRKRIEEVGFETFSTAVQLAMISQDWGIVKEVSQETGSIEIFMPRSASQRQ